MDGHGLTFRGTDLQNGDMQEDASLWFDVWNRWEPAEVRGEDLVIPERPGMEPMTRVKHRRVVELRGWVRGLGSTRAERRESFREASAALMALMDFTLAPGDLVIVAPYLGLESGTETIACRAVNAVGGPVQNRESFQRWTYQLLAIGNPPEWTADES